MMTEQILAEPTMLDHALAYASMGLRVFPLHTAIPVTEIDPVTGSPKLDPVTGYPSRCSCNKSDCGKNCGKHPRNSKGLKEATTNEDKIREWWGKWPKANIGLATGNGLVVVDVDNKKNGIDNWEAIVDAHEKLPDTPLSLTGGGGRHLLFATNEPIKNSVSKLAEGVDVRGDGGYIVAPPSIHASLKLYAWEASSDPKDIPLAPLPAWLRSMLGAPKKAPGGTAEPLVAGAIPEGKRNDTLFRLGRSLRAKGMSEEVVLASLLAANEKQCSPPLDPKEVEVIAGSACSVAPGTSADTGKTKRQEESRQHFDDMAHGKAVGSMQLVRGDSVEIAVKLLSDMAKGSTQPIVFDEGYFWRYSDEKGLWERLDRDDLCVKVGDYAGVIIEKRPLKLSDPAINGAVNYAAKLARHKEFFRHAPTGMHFTNGFVTVIGSEVTMHPHSAEFRANATMGFDFDPAAKPGRFHRFLDEIFTMKGETSLSTDELEVLADDRNDRIRFLAQFIGACLVGEAHVHGVCTVMYGPSASNGKSVLIDIVKALFPRTTVCSIPPQKWINDFVLAELAGCRLNAVAELPEKDILESESFKSVITGDETIAQRKFERPFTLTPKAGHLFAANNLPNTSDQSDGFWRRFIVVPFDRKFEDHEKELGLAKRIIATELASVALWALKGAADLQRQGKYTIPASSIITKDAWQQDSDQVRQWFEECTLNCHAGCDHTDPAGHMSPADAYRSYEYWGKRNGHGRLSGQKFWKRLSKLCEQQRTDTRRFYPRKIVLAWMPPTTWN